jgi:hypothetical protein
MCLYFLAQWGTIKNLHELLRENWNLLSTLSFDAVPSLPTILKYFKNQKQMKTLCHAHSVSCPGPQGKKIRF